MTRKSEGSRGFWIWILILFLALGMYGMPQNIKDEVSSIVRFSLYSPFIWVDSQYRILKNNLSKTIRLERELTQTRLELQSVIETKIENQRLRSLLDFKEKHEYPLVLAEVIGAGEYRFPSCITINRGKMHGIHNGMPVVSADGVVGKVKSAGVNSSAIQIISAPALKISVLDQRSRVAGIATTLGGIMLIMDQVPTGKDVAIGDRIITSGYGGIFPKGLLVGHVVSVSQSPAGMFKKIEIEPAAKLLQLEEIFVMLAQPKDTIIIED